MCFDIGPQHPGWWGQTTSESRNEVYATLCCRYKHVRAEPGRRPVRCYASYAYHFKNNSSAALLSPYTSKPVTYDEPTVMWLFMIGHSLVRMDVSYSLPYFHLYDVALLQMCVLPYKYWKILDMLPNLCEMMLPNLCEMMLPNLLEVSYVQ